MNTLSTATIVYAVVVITVPILITLILAIKAYTDNKKFIKEFNNLKLNSKWVLKSNDTDPFEKQYEVTVIIKQMGTDGKTPWIMFERSSRFKYRMKFENFLELYRPL